MQDFTPRCLNCKYELVGLPDGRCPECGAWFTHAELLEVHRRRQRAIIIIPPRWLLTFAWSLLLAAWPGVSVVGELWVQGFALGAAVWLLADELRFHRRVPMAALLCVGLAMTARWALLAIDMSPGVIPPFAAAFIVAGVMFYFRPDKSSPPEAVVPLVLAGPMLVLGVVMIGDNAADLAKGHYWSEWGDPQGSRWTYPMSVRRAIWVGVATVASGLALVAVGVRFGWNMRRAARTPEDHGQG